MSAREKSATRLGLVIDLDRCTGCGACSVACAVENNVPPAAASASPRTGLTWLRVVRVDNGRPFPDTRSVFVPMMCQHCGTDTPCVAVCPQQAVDVDPLTGVVSQVPERCLGCRYCMAACPYHARVFNWTDPAWPAGSERALNPDVGVRMRGTVEKCNLCHGRRHAADERAAAQGRHGATPSEWTPACVEACPAAAITFGNLEDADDEAGTLARRPGSFRLLARLGTDPKVVYRSNRLWVRSLVEGDVERREEEVTRG
jgi:molybdopterin-containing oxidoreductase family iron-sulfur binding subunit